MLGNVGGGRSVGGLRLEVGGGPGQVKVKVEGASTFEA